MRRLIPLFAFVLLPLSAWAQELSASRGWLHFNGYSHHFSAAEANSQLLGLGWTWYIRPFERVLRGWELDVFQDSARKISAYVGHSWTLPMQYGSLGVTGALMYHRNFGAHNEFSVLPVALPFVETNFRRFKARIYYIPPLRRASDHQIAVQLMIPFWR